VVTRRPSSPRHPSDHGPAPGQDELLALAKRVTQVTECPVVGGVAVTLHGGGRSTHEIDIYAENRWRAHERMEAAGIMWESKARTHIIDGVPVRMVDPATLEAEPVRVSTIKGVRVIALADLVRTALSRGLAGLHRALDLSRVLDLIERIPLKRDFASKLPTKLRAPFKRLVDEVHEPRRTPLPTLKFFKTYGNLAS